MNSPEKGPDFIYKLIAAGDGGVGKTTLLHKYISDKFITDTKMTIGVDIMKKVIRLGDEVTISLQLWDFGGQERFRFLLDSFVAGAHGVLLLFDLTSMTTFNHLKEWVDIVSKNYKEIPIILIGAKADLEERISVSDEYALEAVEEFGFKKYIKVSAKTGLNVEQTFQDIVLEMLKANGEEFLSNLKKKYNFFSKMLF